MIFSNWNIGAVNNETKVNNNTVQAGRTGCLFPDLKKQKLQTNLNRGLSFNIYTK